MPRMPDTRKKKSSTRIAVSRIHAGNAYSPVPLKIVNSGESGRMQISAKIRRTSSSRRRTSTEEPAGQLKMVNRALKMMKKAVRLMIVAASERLRGSRVMDMTLQEQDKLQRKASLLVQRFHKINGQRVSASLWPLTHATQRLIRDPVIKSRAASDEKSSEQDQDGAATLMSSGIDCALIRERRVSSIDPDWYLEDPIYLPPWMEVALSKNLNPAVNVFVRANTNQRFKARTALADTGCFETLISEDLATEIGAIVFKLEGGGILVPLGEKMIRAKRFCHLFVGIPGQKKPLHLVVCVVRPKHMENGAKFILSAAVTISADLIPNLSPEEKALATSMSNRNTM